MRRAETKRKRRRDKLRKRARNERQIISRYRREMKRAAVLSLVVNEAEKLMRILVVRDSPTRS